MVAAKLCFSDQVVLRARVVAMQVTNAYVAPPTLESMAQPSAQEKKLLELSQSFDEAISSKNATKFDELLANGVIVHRGAGGNLHAVCPCRQCVSVRRAFTRRTAALRTAALHLQVLVFFGSASFYAYSHLF